MTADIAPPETVDEVPDPPKPQGRPPKYDYETLFDGRKHKNTRGVQFHSQPRSFRGAVLAAAETRGLDVQVSIRGDDVYVQCVGELDEEDVA